MRTASLPSSQPRTLKDPALKVGLQHLRQTDNVTNWFYLARVYLVLALVIGGYVWFDQWRSASGYGWWWSVPAALLAIVLVGGAQHQFSGLAHEAVHHTLFRNRYLNELASDWFCMFPLFGSTYLYRLQHLAHHQFVNDPVRDPDISQLQASGHWLDFPLSRGRFLMTLLGQLWLPHLVRYLRARASYTVTGTDKNPYLYKDVKPSRKAVRIGVLYVGLLLASLVALVMVGDALLLALVPLALYLLAVSFFAFLPARHFVQAKIRPVIPSRWTTLLRITYITLTFNALAWITYLTGVWAAAYYLLLWIVPLTTAFAFFMILRQLVQHGNGGRGWLTNTRIFFVGPFIRWSIFPAGQDYHLPHHLFATIPHYRLARLHALLMEWPEYRQEAVEVHGYFFHARGSTRYPTVLDVIGPAYAPGEVREVYLDHSVLEDDIVEDKDSIIRDGEEDRERLLGEPDAHAAALPSEAHSER
jgi:fatty acid desaturase